MFDDVLRTWFDRGVDGFRIDVAYAMVKAPGLPDLDDPAGDNPHLWNQPGVHDIFQRWRKLADGYDPGKVLLGEVWLAPADIADYLRPGELHQAFYFDLMQQPFEADAFHRSVAETFDALGAAEGVPTWTLNSHDVHRAVSRYGLVAAEAMASPDPNATRTRPRGEVDVPLGIQRATAALLFMLALPGAVYLYQGEELGLPEVQDLPDEARQDPIWERSGHTEHGRDGCRVPLPWSEQDPGLGFTSGTPWLPQPDWFAAFAADRQAADPASVLSLYRRAVAARRLIDHAAPLAWLDSGRPDVVAFTRGSHTCVTVFDGDPFPVPDEWGRLTLSTGPASDRVLPAGTSGWFMA
jgi:alpha-glucosidase